MDRAQDVFNTLLSRSVFMRLARMVFLLLLFAAPLWAAEATPDPAARFLGQWEGPANVYDDLNAIKPTNTALNITRSKSEPQYLVVELTILKTQTMRLTKCELHSPGELRVREEVMSDLRRLRVDGVLKSRHGTRIEEGYIRFFVETETGDFRPYYTVKLAAKRSKPPSEISEP